MNENDKQDMKELLHNWASRSAAKANTEAKSASGWKRLLWALGAILAGAVAYFTTGCTASYTQSAEGDIAFTTTIVQPEPYRK